MKKQFVVLGLSAMLLLTACGKSDRDQLKENMIENGFDKESAEEFLNELSDEDVEEIMSFAETSEEASSEETVEEVVDYDIEPLDEIVNAKFIDAKVQIYDMVFPLDGSITIGDAVKIIENSKYSFEYDIPKDGMVTGSQTYYVSINGNNAFSLVANQLSDGSYDSTYDAMLCNVVVYDNIAGNAILPGGIYLEGDKNVDDILTLLDAQGFSSEQTPETFSYSLNGVGISFAAPAKNKGLDGKRYMVQYDIEIDSSNKQVKAVKVQENPVNLSGDDTTKSQAFVEGAHWLQYSDDLNKDAVKKALEVYANELIGVEISNFYGTATPSSAVPVELDLYYSDKTSSIVYECETDAGHKFIRYFAKAMYISDDGSKVFVERMETLDKVGKSLDDVADRVNADTITFE